jgi:glycosyltransferase involved in cell wall biosynthesis
MNKTQSSDNCIHSLTRDKKVLFITTKNIDYIRNTQEIEDIKGSAQSVKILGYKDKGYITRLIKIYYRLLTMPLISFDLIFVGFSPQLILPLFGFRFKGKLVVEDFFISLYDTMVNDRKRFKEKSIFVKVCFWIDRITIKKADAIIVDTRAHGDYFVREFNADKNKINVLYLKADSSIYYPRQGFKPKEWEDKFVVLYFGSILPLQGINIILKCVELMQNIDSVVFEIIGPIKNDDLNRYKQFKNVKFIPWLSQQDLAEEIAKSDLCLSGHFNKTIAKASRTIPGKAYIYDAMQKPMILGENPANHEFFYEDNIKYFYVEMGNPEKLKEKIIYIAEGQGLR